MTSSEPSNQSELQLYRVLQRANLLQYYDTFIQQGGDDVQQLCEAGEEEFLEIMALVGMAKKPLHVRRLQKALQEWVSNPVPFQQPLDSDSGNPDMTRVGLSPVTSAAAIVAAIQHAAASVYTAQPASLPNMPSMSIPPIPTVVTSHANKVIDIKPESQGVVFTADNLVTTTGWPTHGILGRTSLSPSPGSPRSPTAGSVDGSSQCDVVTGQLDCAPSPNSSDCKRGVSPTPSTGSGSGSNGYEHRLSTSPVPCSGLSEHQVQAIGNAAEKITHSLPPLVPKAMNMRKQIAKEIEDAMNLPFDEPGRLELMRKYGAIYGRFDSKRKNEKPMSLHEVSVNEAAAHLCFHIPALLTRREELFPLARQVVRQSGYQYAKGHSRSVTAQSSLSDGCSPIKRPRVDLMYRESYVASTNMAVQDQGKREQDRLVDITRQLSQIASEQEGLRAQIAAARDAEEYERLHSLQAELEELMTWNAQLTAEHGHLSRLATRAMSSRSGLKTRSMMSEVESPEIRSLDSPSLPPNVPTPPLRSNGIPVSGHMPVEFQPQDYYKIQAGRSGNNTSEFVSDTLYDEGLRIAQQYGMSDFAAELKVLKPEKSPEMENGCREEDEEDSRRQEREREKGEEEETPESDEETGKDQMMGKEEENTQEDKDGPSSQDQTCTLKSASNTVKLKGKQNQTDS